VGKLTSIELIHQSALAEVLRCYSCLRAPRGPDSAVIFRSGSAVEPGMAGLRCKARKCIALPIGLATATPFSQPRVCASPAASIGRRRMMEYPLLRWYFGSSCRSARNPSHCPLRDTLPIACAKSM